MGNGRIAVTFTGGIDSTFVLYEQGVRATEIYMLACNYGQANWLKTVELGLYHQERLQNLGVDTRFIQLDVPIPSYASDHGQAGPLRTEGFVPPEKVEKVDYTQQRKTYDYALIDGRNAFLFLHMLCFCSNLYLPVLYTGHQYEPEEWEQLDSYRHRTEDFGPLFLDRINLLQEVGFRNRVRVEAPLLSQRMSKLDVMLHLRDTWKVDLEQHTYSCQFWPKCGKCDNCINLESVFKQLGV